MANRVHKVQVIYNHQISNKHKWNNSFMKNSPKYREIFPTLFCKNKQKVKICKNTFTLTRLYACLWYNGIYSRMAKPMKTLELHCNDPVFNKKYYVLLYQFVLACYKVRMERPVYTKKKMVDKVGFCFPYFFYLDL